MHRSTAGAKLRYSKIPTCQPTLFSPSPLFSLIFIFYFILVFFHSPLVIGPKYPRVDFPPLVTSLSRFHPTHTNHFFPPRPSSLRLPLPTPSPHNTSLTMIMVQKPHHLLSSPSTHHRRHPSAPPAVLVQPTHIPGLLSLSKPRTATPPRSQPHQQQHHGNHNRQSRSSHNKPKQQITASRPPAATANAQPPLAEDLNKLSTPARPPPKSHTLTVTPSPAPEKPPRGRQNAKQGKDKSKPR